MTDKHSDVLLRVAEVTKTFATDDVLTFAVRGADLTIRGGEVVAITGPSGSGKSTLLSLLGLLDRPTAGEVYVGSTATAALSGGARSRLRNATFAYIFQNFSLIPQLNAIENVELPLVYRGDAAHARREAASEALARVGMSHRLGHMPAQLSGGEQQRVAIARAIVMRPRAVLADEPTGNLDSANASRIMDLLLGLRENGSAIVFVTHDPALAALAPRRVALMDGCIVHDGAAAPALPAAVAGETFA